MEGQYLAPGADPVPCSAPVFRLAADVIERVASTEAPQPVLAVVLMRDRSVPTDATFVMVADRVSDPGNAGTIVRSAEAAGAHAVVFTPGSVDVYNPKVVRSTAGSLFRVPVCVADLHELRGRGMTLLGTSSHRGAPHTATDLTTPVAVVVGNEAHGVPDNAPVDGWVTIRHHGAAESLNVAMAATVLAFEVARQRGDG